MVEGEPPFYEETQQELLQKILNYSYSLEGNPISFNSPRGVLAAGV